MTIAERISYDTAERTRESTTIQHIQALLKKGFDANFIADVFELPLQKVEEIIQKIRGLNS